jgi:hypothetical protein
VVQRSGTPTEGAVVIGARVGLYARHGGD